MHVSDKLLLSEAEAAKLLDLSPRFLQQRRYAGGGPRFVRVSSRCVKYLASELEEWARERLRTSTSDPGGASEERADA